jgi:hypothetical protein
VESGRARTRGTAQAGFDWDDQMRLIERRHRQLPWTVRRHFAFAV